MEQTARNSYRITGRQGHFSFAQFTITTEEIVIGRDASACRIVYPTDTPQISRRHCSLREENGVLYLRDLGSTYGTFLTDGTRLAPLRDYPLTEGTGFCLGSQAERFSAEFPSRPLPRNTPAPVSRRPVNSLPAQPRKKSHGGLSFFLIFAALLILFFSENAGRNTSYAQTGTATTSSYRTQNTNSSATKKTNATVATEEDNKRATVHIRAMNTNTLKGGYGTGVILQNNNNGILLVTAYHVLDQGSNVHVTATFLNGTTVDVDSWRYWKEMDIAFIKISKNKVPCKTRQYIKTAKLKDVTMDNGDAVYGIAYHTDHITTHYGSWRGYYNGYDYTMSETNYSVDHGGSGGGLFTESGYFVGICLKASDDRTLYTTASQLISCKSKLGGWW